MPQDKNPLKELKLNLGCGVYPLKGYINVDILPQFGDVHYSVDRLPYAGSVDEIYAGHIIEHIPKIKLDVMLMRWYAALKRGGILTVVIPDFTKSLALYQEGKLNLPQLESIIFGYNDSEDLSEWHKYLIDEKIAKDLLSKHFDTIEILETHPNLPAEVSWQTIIQCTKN